jgi:hypothetical protein
MGMERSGRSGRSGIPVGRGDQVRVEGRRDGGDVAMGIGDYRAVAMGKEIKGLRRGQDVCMRCVRDYVLCDYLLNIDASSWFCVPGIRSGSVVFLLSKHQTKRNEK